MDIKEKVGRRIKDLRLKNNLSQEKFSHKCELDRTYIASVEKGERNISIINLEKIAHALGLNLSDLLEGL